MTEVTLYLRSGILCGLEASGHADDSAVKGEDVVCAAVSSLVQALAVGLGEVACADGFELEIEPSVPMIKMRWLSAAGGIDILTETIELSLRKIAKEHPDYICITEVQL